MLQCVTVARNKARPTDALHDAIAAAARSARHASNSGLQHASRSKERVDRALCHYSLCNTLAGHRKTLPVICSTGRSWLAHYVQ
jgi:hypothetical protein